MAWVFHRVLHDISNAKTRCAFLRSGFRAQQFSMAIAPYLTGPVKRISKYFSTCGKKRRPALRPNPRLVINRESASFNDHGGGVMGMGMQPGKPMQ
jgi:hypothetical protein